MTLARPVLPGKTYMPTRRATRRHWLLRPDADGGSQQSRLYTLGYNANKSGILVHNLYQISSHDHETITDVLGTAPLLTRAAIGSKPPQLRVLVWVRRADTAPKS
ncbi:MAG: hypothetical protein OEZ06_31200 [Myxococcales bacterium]|nr:hypothetical protein [Myxococcales bacterium]